MYQYKTYPLGTRDPSWTDEEYLRIADLRNRALVESIKPIREQMEQKAAEIYEKAFRQESDPHGKSAGQPGAKLDAGKPAVGRGCLHYFPRALTAVAELSTIGAKKYSWKGWADVPDGIHRYSDALARHELRIEDDFTRRDPDTNVLEATAVAWNALARLELILRESK